MSTTYIGNCITKPGSDDEVSLGSVVRRIHTPPLSRTGSHGSSSRLRPHAKLFLANGTGAFESYAQRLRRGEGEGVPILSTVLAASEGLMGISLSPSDDGCIIEAVEAQKEHMQKEVRREAVRPNLRRSRLGRKRPGKKASS